MSSSPPAPDESLSNIIASPEYDGIISAIYHRDEDISNASRQLSVAKTAQKRAAPHMTAHPPAASPPGAPAFSSPFQSDFCQISQISVKPQSNFAPAPAADGAPDAPARRQRHDKLRAKLPSLTISIWVTWALAFCCSTWPKNLASKIRQNREKAVKKSGNNRGQAGVLTSVCSSITRPCAVCKGKRQRFS